jgi:hypothetical protein
MKNRVSGNKEVCVKWFVIENLNGFIIVLQNSPLSVIEKIHSTFQI